MMHTHFILLVWEIFDLTYATISEPEVNIREKISKKSYKHTPHTPNH